jgi:HSP20 family protein
MTLYINPLRQASRQRILNDLMRGWEDNYDSELTFPIDVRADSDSFTLKALLPGVKAEDLNIHIVNETVTIAGELKADREEDSSYLLTERPSGKFQRVLTLPTQLDPDKVEANLEDGVLTLRIPKAEEAKPRTIKVQAK